MKSKHNKKRNTAFLFEVLAREVVKSALKKDDANKNRTINIIKEHFSRNTELGKELSLYKALTETENLKPYVAEKLIQEAKVSHRKIDKNILFKEQSALISKINKSLSKDVFANYVPNYKSIATISQMFNDNVSAKSRVLLESVVLDRLTRTPDDKLKEKKNINNLTLRTFVSKYNEAYSEKLLPEQNELLNHYIMSFSDNAIGLKLFLNEELSRLKEGVEASLSMDEIKGDREMLDKTTKVLKVIEEFKNTKIDKDVVLRVLKIQNLVKEIKEP